MSYALSGVYWKPECAIDEVWSTQAEECVEMACQAGFRAEYGQCQRYVGYVPPETPASKTAGTADEPTGLPMNESEAGTGMTVLVLAAGAIAVGWVVARG